MTPARALVTGGAGRVGHAVAARLIAAGWDVAAPGHDRLDVTQEADVRAAFDALRPALVVHAAALTDVDACEREPERAQAVNGGGVDIVARAAGAVGAHLCVLSTDQVFGGSLGRPRTEFDPVAPLSAYGRSKWAGEQAAGLTATIVRTAWLSSMERPCAVLAVLAQAADPGAEMCWVDDERGSPTVVDDLVGPLLALAVDRVPGRFHVTNEGGTTWAGLARHVLTVAGHDPDRVQGVAGDAWRGLDGAPRPADAVLDGAALRLHGLPALRPWQDAVAELVGRATGRAPSGADRREDTRG